ncbi:uracil-DNA glycosylase family protein [Aliiglaciecola sp. CAU 1673]|uniref:uracil-DNA glycosylase family protein n=1 Tax=Aliiglaciecola sp. CAU 1673 TaxID=3032595 RepID=UPI0023DC7FFD|nr:uracil-DNA glycosylase family protein [Aliiglaciecola sp. CAU 1673]MDF2180333.1 uracil-DNA glycosylase family protein [Aliiglaciecola sp. CAU 1673]
METALILEEIRSCRLCEAHLPLGANPVVRASQQARLMVIGQAPGTKVHKTSVPWNDPSGDRLREWLGVDRETFYDHTRIAIMPMGFCYPGKGKSGDLPPRKECAPTWHQRLLASMPNIKLTLLIGQYAQAYYLQDRRSLTQRVQHWQDYLPEYLVLPHPSPRNNLWLRKHPWFEEEVIPALKSKVLEILEPQAKL